MQKLQQEARDLMKAGHCPARAVLLLARRYELSMRTCEILFFSLKGLKDA